MPNPASSRPFPPWTRAFVVLLLSMTFATPSLAQFQLTKRVVAGGGSSMGSPNYGILGTTGQTAAGSLEGDNYTASVGFWTVAGAIVTGVGGSPLAPASFSLQQNHPNPFNPTTVIPFALPKDCHVRLRVFDLAGRLVLDLIDERRPAGHYRETFVATSLASGIYFYRFEAAGVVQTRRLALLK